MVHIDSKDNLLKIFGSIAFTTVERQKELALFAAFQFDCICKYEECICTFKRPLFKYNMEEELLEFEAKVILTNEHGLVVPPQ